MKLLAFIVPPISKWIRADQGDLVVRGWILALFLAAPFALLSCGGKELRVIEPEQVIAAADSANKALDGTLKIARDTSIQPSMFFDTLYRHYASARLIEREKRLDGDSLARAAVLAVDNVKQTAIRERGIRILNAFLRRDSVRAARRDSLRNALAVSLERMTDSSTLTRDQLSGLIAELTSRKRFEPDFRQQLDSLIHGTVEIELQILSFLNEVGGKVKVEEVLQFADPNDLTRYRYLTTQLAELAAAQQQLVDQVTYGIQPMEPDSSRRLDSSGTANSRPQQPVQTWPDAVKLQ